MTNYEISVIQKQEEEYKEILENKKEKIYERNRFNELKKDAHMRQQVLEQYKAEKEIKRIKDEQNIDFVERLRTRS